MDANEKISRSKKMATFYDQENKWRIAVLERNLQARFDRVVEAFRESFRR